jgi:ribose transport system ATP-binding protein
MDRADMVRLMIGRDETAFAAPAVVVRSGPPALELRGVASSLGHRDISLQVHAGEVLGLYGLIGAGRSELARTIIGAAKVTDGEVLIDGAVTRIRDVADAVRRHGIGYVSEDRKGDGLILQHDIAANIAVTVWHRLKRFLGFFSDRMQNATAAPLARALDVRTPSLAQRVGNLSGGNQQKVSVAKWLAAGTRILIVDEPTVGIDIRSKAYLHDLILRLSRQGTAVIVISSDMPELVGLADRIAVMRGFRLVDTFDNARNYAQSSQRIMAAIHG